MSAGDQDKQKTPPVEPPQGFFARRRAAKAATSEENKDSNVDAQPSDEHDASTVSFSQLFRCVLFFPSRSCEILLYCYKKSFSTRSELFIDAIGLLVALGSGAAQVSLGNRRRLIMP